MGPLALFGFGAGKGLLAKIIAAANLAFLIQTGNQIVNFVRDRFFRKDTTKLDHRILIVVEILQI